MIIGIDARFLTHPQRGGFKTYTRALVSALASVDGQHRYILYTDRQPDTSLQFPSNFTLRPVPALNPLVREQMLLPLAMKLDGVDLAHFPCNTGPIFRSPKMVITVHDAIPMRISNGEIEDKSFKQRVLHSYWRAVMPRSARRASLVITDSQYSRADLRVVLNMMPDRLRVVPISIDTVFTGDLPGARPAEIEPGTSFIMAFASPDGRKNHPAVIEAFRAVAPRFSALKLALVCSHPDIRSTISGDGVIPIGPVSTEELVWLYRNALALVFPSFDEGFGLPPLEAMACGSAVIASRTGSLPEVLGNCAIHIDPASVESITQGLSRVLADSGLREDLSQRGRRHAACFSSEDMGRKLLAVYHEAANRSSAGELT